MVPRETSYYIIKNPTKFKKKDFFKKSTNHSDKLVLVKYEAKTYPLHVLALISFLKYLTKLSFFLKNNHI